jgi:predicted ATPase
MAERVIISGGPGAGKSTLIAALAARGERCFPEVSRELIREQHARGGRLLPWCDMAGFAAECRRRMHEQLAIAPTDRRSFFDRGLPDITGYLRHYGLAPDERLLAEARQAYAPFVFMAPPWQEIYVHDPERPQPWAEAVALHDRLEEAYREAGYTLVTLPRVPADARVKFVDALLAARRGEVLSWAD